MVAWGAGRGQEVKMQGDFKLVFNGIQLHFSIRFCYRNHMLWARWPIPNLHPQILFQACRRNSSCYYLVSRDFEGEKLSSLCWMLQGYGTP